MPGKGQVNSCIATPPKGVHAINDILWERKFHPMVTDQAAPSGEAHKVITALMIASGAEGNGTGGMGVHGVVMFLMCLHVAPELQAAVFVVIENVAQHKYPGTQSVGYAIMCQKHVEPEDAGVYHHLFKHESGKTQERDKTVL